jgi:gluconate 2-dehydrogenase gamma chain
MSNHSVTRRDILRTLVVGSVAGSVLRLIPAQAAEYAHGLIESEKAASPAGAYVPKYFSSHQYETLKVLCDIIVPKDERSGGAVEAGAPEFIDLLTSENDVYQIRLGGGLGWLDSHCADLWDKTFLQSAGDQRTQVLDQIAYRKNGLRDASLTQGIAFFSFLRKLTFDGFYSSKIGIADLQYIGNTSVREFPGCPALPEA